MQRASTPYPCLIALMAMSLKLFFAFIVEDFSIANIQINCLGGAKIRIKLHDFYLILSWHNRVLLILFSLAYYH